MDTTIRAAQRTGRLHAQEHAAAAALARSLGRQMDFAEAAEATFHAGHVGRVLAELLDRLDLLPTRGALIDPFSAVFSDDDAVPVRHAAG